MIIKYSMECNHCGNRFIGNRTLDLTQEDENEVEIDIDMFGGFSMMCPECGCEYFIPSISDYIEIYEEDCWDEEKEDEEDEEDE